MWYFENFTTLWTNCFFFLSTFSGACMEENITKYNFLDFGLNFSKRDAIKWIGTFLKIIPFTRYLSISLSLKKNTIRAFSLRNILCFHCHMYTEYMYYKIKTYLKKIKHKEIINRFTKSFKAQFYLFRSSRKHHLS